MEYLNSYSYYLMDQVLEKVDYEWDFKKGIEIDHRNGIKRKLKDSFDKSNDKLSWYKRILKKMNSFKPMLKKSIIFLILPLMLNSNIDKPQIIETTKVVDTEVVEIVEDKLGELVNDDNDKIETNLRVHDPVKMSVDDNGIEFIKSEEKLRLEAYSIGDGMITIGYGHAEPIKKSKYKIGDKISKEKAERIFQKDLKRTEKGVKRIFKQWKKQGINIYLTQNQFNSLVSMAFNMGVGGLRKTEMIQLVKKGDMKGAKERIKTTGVEAKFGGLFKRRIKESDLFSV